MTRGRNGNHAYVATDTADDAHVAPHPSENPDATARSVLFGVLQHVGAELSAHETITAEQERWGSIAQLAAEYDTIAQAAQHDRWVAVLTTAGLDDEQVDAVLGSDAYGALSAELRRAEANHHNLDTLLPRLVKARGFADADDIASVIHHRVARATVRPAGSGRTRKTPALIARLIPQAAGPMRDDMNHALAERRELIEQRADAVLDTALTDAEPWVTTLGTIPEAEKGAARWRAQARVVAAYRDRYSITATDPLGPAPESDAQKIDRTRADAVLRALTRQPAPDQQPPEMSRRIGAGRTI